MDQQLCIFDIKRFALHDGPGIRTSVFLKGCPLVCGWCHNPEGIRPDIECYSQEVVFESHSWTENFEVGRWIRTDLLMSELLKDRIFMETSGGGITFTGGEPLQQHEALFEMLGICRREGIHTAIDTSGYAPAELIMDASERCDLILYDLKTLDERKHRSHTGQGNAMILQNLALLLQGQSPVIIRIPLIRGFNATVQEAERYCALFSSLQENLEVHLLPYHPYGKHKYERFRRPAPENGLRAPELAMIQHWAELLRQHGHQIKIGG